MYNVSVCLSLVEDVSFSGPVRDARHPWHQSNPDEWGQDARHPYNTIKQVGLIRHINGEWSEWKVFAVEQPFWGSPT